MSAKIADDLGRLFEVGFNMGILSYIQQNNLKNRFGSQGKRILSIRTI
ncbi:hypothetical protein VB638_13600 [Dolichospermum sp. UHCC 0684]|nr:MULTISPECIES: hypothetical protein [unclassified Dolichospermum]MEA5530604.1 hypothetical protein [Dolichospermum sp. UHCC 0684]